MRFHDSKLKLAKVLLFRSFHETDCRFLFSVYLWKRVLCVTQDDVGFSLLIMSVFKKTISSSDLNPKITKSHDVLRMKNLSRKDHYLIQYLVTQKVYTPVCSTVKCTTKEKFSK